MSRFAEWLRSLRTGASRVASLVIGNWQWQPPAWALTTHQYAGRGRRYLAADWRRWALLLLVLVCAAGGYRWYKTRPVPHYVAYSVTPPALTTYTDNGSTVIQPMMVQFSESAAPLLQVGKRVGPGIELS